jgi:hypothetical protein
MTRTFKTLLAVAFLAFAFAAGPAMAEADGKVEWRPSSGEPKKNVVIRQNGNTLIIRTDPRAADRIAKMVRDSDRVVIRDRRTGFTYYPENYYPYYRNRGAAYSAGRAIGTKND